jgi:hypothetical protein
MVLIGLSGEGDNDRSGRRKVCGASALQRLDPSSGCRRSGMDELR